MCMFQFFDCFLFSTLCSIGAAFHSPGILRSAGPFPGTTKELHCYLMPLLIMVTLHIPICGMHELLYVCNTIFVHGPVYLSDICVLK